LSIVVYRSAVLGAVIAGAFLFAAQAQAADAPPEAVARIGSTDISATQLRDFIRNLDPAVRKQALADPAVMNKLVRQELARMALLNEAQAKKWEQRPEIVARIQQSRDDVVVTTYLASVGAVPADYPTDAQVQTAYDQNRDKFMVPRQYHLQQIFVQLPAGSDKKAEDAAEKKAEDLARRAKAKGANFEELARANTDGKEMAQQGGDLGWTPESQIIPEIRTQVAGMSPGEISEPIRTAQGWHIIRMVETKPAAPRPLAEIRDQLVAYIRQQKLQENEQAYIQALPLAVNEIGLKKIFEAAQ
jgi:peptidylprolyl isomerase